MGKIEILNLVLDSFFGIDYASIKKSKFEGGPKTTKIKNCHRNQNKKNERHEPSNISLFMIFVWEYKVTSERIW